MGNVPDTAYVDTSPPIFLFGFERSGTTLLSMMVGAHPRIAMPFSTTELWYRYGALLDRYNGLDAARDVERIVDDLLQEERICLWDVTLVRDEVLNGLAPGSYPNVIARFHTLYAQHTGKDRWGNIAISTLNNMDMANVWFPNARFIHIVRDGRDVALSHETYPYGSSNVGECANAWVHQLRVNLKMGAILGPNRYLVVRYEDLILESEPTLRRMCEFMGVAYSSAMLEYPSMVEKKVPENRRWLWPVLNKPPAKSNVYRWKTKLSTTKRIVFERAAGGMLAEFGYEVYARVPKRMRAYLLELWYFLDRGGRFKRFLTQVGVKRLSRLERDWYNSKRNAKRQAEPPGDARAGI